MQEILNDLIAAGVRILGYLAVGFGAWLIWPPLAWLWSGLVLNAIASQMSHGNDAEGKK